MSSSIIFILLLTLILQIICTIYAYKMKSNKALNGSRIFWAYLFTGFCLMCIDRIVFIALYVYNKIFESIIYFVLLDIIFLPLLVSIFLSLGIVNAFLYNKHRYLEYKQATTNIEHLKKLTKELTTQLYKHAKD